jgi:hypothetical protein
MSSKELSVVQKLIEYSEKGFVFHGSPNPNIKILEPRPAEDIKKVINIIMTLQYLQHHIHQLQ